MKELWTGQGSPYAAVQHLQLAQVSRLGLMGLAGVGFTVKLEVGVVTVPLLVRSLRPAGAQA